jgi:hypothetical protein
VPAGSGHPGHAGSATGSGFGGAVAVALAAVVALADAVALEDGVGES